MVGMSVVVVAPDSDGISFSQKLGAICNCDVKNFNSIDHLLVSDVGEIFCLILDIRLCVASYTPITGVPTILVTHGITVLPRMLVKSNYVLDFVYSYSDKNIHLISSLLSSIEQRTKINVGLYQPDPFFSELTKRTFSSMGLQVNSFNTIKAILSYIKSTEKLDLLVISGLANEELLRSTILSIREIAHKEELHIFVLLEESFQNIESLLYQWGVNDSFRLSLSSLDGILLFQSRLRISLSLLLSHYQMSFLAQHDSMTGAYNRRYFSKMGEGIYHLATRGDLSIAVAMIDIDNFKNINDTYGHPFGDRVICDLHYIIESQVRRNDIVARFGGEEFCILFSGKSVEDIGEVLERLRKIVNSHCIPYEGQDVSFTISIGYCSELSDSLESMISNADKELYLAKQSGKNCLYFEGKPYISQ